MKGVSSINTTNLASPPAGGSSTEQSLDPQDSPRTIAYRSFLVPIDFSAHSKKTVEHAAQLALLTGGSIKILHVLQMPEYPTGYYEAIYIQPELVAGVVETAKRDANEQLSRVVGEMAAKGLEAQAILRVGNGYEEIVSVAKEMKSDLIIIGSRGYQDLGRILLGSTLDRVLQYAPCPVLVVKEASVDRLAGRTEAHED
jgi:nucleotide-binding universal stress UspA family protein